MTSYSKVVELIKEQNIVALFQGKSESGPRALGNRSLLFDPRNPNGKEIVNNIKKREFFRPFAGTILLDHVNEWFDMRGLKDSPYMMYAVKSLPHTFNKIPSIIHVDGTCRIQTITKEQNLHYYNLIEEFYSHTQVPILFNTSFNLAGEPLVRTLDDAIRTLENSDIEYLFIPEKMELIFIKNKK
jgi:carbamoyltransferase